MPVYDYLCERCGPFTAMRPMAECELPDTCPECGAPAPRAIITAPRLATLSRQQRSAAAVNERSAHAPRTLSQAKAAHRPGCACCTPKAARSSRDAGHDEGRGAKSFPGKRPWMISH